MKKASCCLIWATIIGVILLIAGIVVIPVAKNLIHNKITEQITLKSNATYQNWVKNPTPIFFQLWVWDLQNPDEVKNGGKPSLVQRGPYSYRENRHKINVSFHDENDTVTYKEDKYYVFDRAMSNGTEDDKFTTVNIPLMLIANIVKREVDWLQKIADALIEWGEKDVFMTLSVKDLVWGYDEPLINKTVTLLQELGLPIHIDDHFGLFVGTNNSDDGWYNIKTGQGDPSLFGVIQKWNWNNTLPYWTTPTCNMVNGTDGTIFHPFVDKSDVMYVFSTDLCRSIYFTYLEPSSQQGIDLYRFSTPPDVFMSHIDNPANQGYCTPSDNCLPSGLLNMENCHDGAPLVFSQPHFLNADKAVINGVYGMHPNIEEHGTFIDIEPNTGAAFYAAKKLQANIALERVPNIKSTLKLPTVVLPVVWLNESSKITKSLADEFKSELQTPLLVIHVGTYLAIGLGAFLVLMSLTVAIFRKLREKQYKRMTEYTDAN
ncbi:lysosome membrane protein 2-like [Mya arenaria]|uniref:lysosome membrane protein 2-like n=1 Tax=Mya arenaria TaxID=6604 RepID=UPI0022E16589|nr:lysosome membrane protein 2-like [Mya arenaria]